eukprot:NODE_3666_length_391_cov_33.026515_g3616_i0.p1 GENE.NODE_3666_length_391_cov_33.026515_g3616_i0~~NODE_3666_length_391_cov_33.026515_g3616_i0.p1  ORF type:complete len:109 (+),score=12.31 NODE_3666_length_391_cov_33.026515_g3616_i0:62-388(+)
MPCVDDETEEEQYTTQGGAECVKLVYNDKTGTVGKDVFLECEIPQEWTDAKLHVTAEGPTKAKTIKVDSATGCRRGIYVNFGAKGDYKISIRYCDQHIPGSPFPVTIS